MNLVPAPINAAHSEKNGLFNRVWARWFSDRDEYIKRLSTGADITIGDTNPQSMVIMQYDGTKWNLMGNYVNV
jgi:hypothetical protein